MKVEGGMSMEREACRLGGECSRIDTTHSNDRSPFVKQFKGERGANEEGKYSSEVFD